MNKSLNGLRILNTRPQEQAQTLSQDIKNLGGIVIECPALAITPIAQDWFSTLPPLDEIHHAIFISPNAVRYALAEFARHNRAWPSHLHVIAVGSGTARALKERAIKIGAIPTTPDSEHLVRLESLQNLKDSGVLLFKGEGGRTLIAQELIKRGASLTLLSVYRRTLPAINTDFLNSLWRNDLVDIILFTSEQSLHHFFKLLGTEAHSWLKAKPCLVISARLAKTAALLGIKKIIISHPEQMIRTLLDYKD